MKQLIFSDIDGTLLNKDRELSEATITEVQRIHPENPFILISSRMPKAMRHLQMELGIEDLPLLCYNGGLILVDHKIVHSTEIPLHIIEALVQHAGSTHISLYHNDEWYVPEMDYWANREASNTKVTPVVQSYESTLSKWEMDQKGAHKIMCMGTAEEIDAIVSFLTKQYSEDLHLYRSKPTYLEIANKQVSKLTAIEYLIQHIYKTSIYNVIAFGDNYNDIPMLEKVGMGVAVANAKPEVLNIANHITSSNIEDGVANYLKTYL